MDNAVDVEGIPLAAGIELDSIPVPSGGIDVETVDLIRDLI